MLRATSERDRATLSHRTCEELFWTHRSLCARAARRFVRDGLERCDLEQVAAIGLLKACSRYDAQTGTPFEAFASILISGELMHFVRDNERTVRLPRSIQTLARRRAKMHEQLVRELQREPEPREVAQAMGIGLSLLLEVDRAVHACAPGEAEPDRWAEQRPERPGDRLCFEELLDPLTKPQRLVIVGIYHMGFNQAEIARRLNVGPRQVSRLHRRALEAIARGGEASPPRRPPGGRGPLRSR